MVIVVKFSTTLLNYTYPIIGENKLEMIPSVPQWAIEMDIELHPNDIKTLVKAVNIFGQEVIIDNQPKGTVLLYLYNDGTVEKENG